MPAPDGVDWARPVEEPEPREREKPKPKPKRKRKPVKPAPAPADCAPNAEFVPEDTTSREHEDGGQPLTGEERRARERELREEAERCAAEERERASAAGPRAGATPTDRRRARTPT